uniref:KIB1-4 beta-propeller domain-containing protein n=1 Tax=Chenopodium quinoa TaxID=63459 RepID=A0A803L8A5_CHEQI
MPETETLLVAAEKMIRQETSWSDISADILSVITNHLENRLDFCSFRAVCKTCQGAASMSRFAGKNNILSQILPYHFSITVLSQEYQYPPQILTGRSGLLAKISLGDGLMSPLHGHGDMKFDDIVMFKERVCAVDRKGRGFWIDNGVLGEMFAMDKTTGEDFKGCWKKRLVEFCGELYLVTRCLMHMKVAFEVYKLNEKSKTWDKLDGIGKDRIIFATVDGCFFVLARDLPACSGNCIVVGRDVFPSYNAEEDELENYWECPDIAAAFDVVIFDFGSGEWRPIEIDPEYNKVLYPQPWLSLDANMSKLFSRKGKDVVQDSFLEKCPDSSGTREASSSLGHRLDEQANDISFHMSDIVLENLSALALGIANLCDDLNTVAGSALTNTEPLKSGVIAKTKFQEIEVSPDLIPTLEEIWANHGNIFEESMIRGEYALRWALESIAKMTILVENSSDGSLSESQAEYVCSTLYHLQILRFNITWLAPSIVKALNMYYSTANIEARRLARGG